MCRKEVSRETVRNIVNLLERYYINQIAEFSHHTHISRFVYCLLFTVYLLNIAWYNTIIGFCNNLKSNVVYVGYC